MPDHHRDDEDELVEDEQMGLFSDVFAIFFFIFIVIISVAVILELKHEYHVDLFNGINTPFDDSYFAVKKTFTGKAPNQTGR